MTVLTMTRGDRKAFVLTFLTGAGTALDLTDATLTFTAKRSVWRGAYDADDVWGLAKTALSIAKTETDGIVVDDDPKTGLATLTLEPEDTEDLTDDDITGAFDWDVEVRTTDDVDTPLRGQLVIRADVTVPAAS